MVMHSLSTHTSLWKYFIKGNGLVRSSPMHLIHTHIDVNLNRIWESGYLLWEFPFWSDVVRLNCNIYKQIVIQCNSFVMSVLPKGKPCILFIFSFWIWCNKVKDSPLRYLPSYRLQSQPWEFVVSMRMADQKKKNI